MAVQGLGLSEVGEVFVVGKDLDREGRAVEVMSPGFKGADDGEEFAIIDIIVSFCLRERLGEVGAGVPIPV